MDYFFATIFVIVKNDKRVHMSEIHYDTFFSLKMQEKLCSLRNVLPNVGLINLEIASGKAT